MWDRDGVDESESGLYQYTLRKHTERSRQRPLSFEERMEETHR